jgi:hypothetical protein
MSDEETPEETKRRWIEEESGPGGILSEEGISGGGIFGGAIAPPQTDPGANSIRQQVRAWRAIADGLERRVALLAEENEQLRLELADQKRMLEGKSEDE